MNISEPSHPNDDLDLGMGSAPRRNATRRGLYIGAACAAVATAVGAVLVLRDDPSNSVAPAAVAETSAPSVVTSLPPAIDTIVATTPSIVETPSAPQTTSVKDLPTTVPATTPESTLPETTVSAPADTTAPPASTTPALPHLVEFAVDFTADAPALQPAHLQSANSGFAGVTVDDRLFVASSEVVLFLDGTTGQELSWFTWAPNDTRTVFGIGPDDVLYVNEQTEEGNTLVAYAPDGDQYVEVARVPHLWGDLDPGLDETGVALIDANGSPSHFDYVDATGVPSGKTMTQPIVSFNDSPQNVCDFTTPAARYRLSFVWPATHVDDETFYGCDGLSVGRGDTAVLTSVDYQTGGDLDTRITILSDSPTTFRSNGWSYVGQIGTRLFFTSDTGDGSIDIGTVEA